MAVGTSGAVHSAEIPTPTHEAIIRRNQDARAQQQAQHTAVISLTVRNTNKILKEIGFRRARLRVSLVCQVSSRIDGIDGIHTPFFHGMMSLSRTLERMNLFDRHSHIFCLYPYVSIKIIGRMCTKSATMPFKY